MIACLVVIFLALITPLRAQDHDTAGAHPKSTLYVAEMSGEEIAPEPLATSASATGAFVLEASRELITVDYDLTYDALDQAPTRIVLRNAGEGGIGEVVHVVCGEGAEQACPQQTGATISGRWTSEDEPPLTFDLVREIAALRTYIEVEAGDGMPVIRGQLTTNRSMVMADGFVARLRPQAGEGDEASGTAAVFVRRMPGGAEEVDYSFTVTGLPAPVSEAGIVVATAQPPDAQRLLTFALQGPQTPSGASRVGRLASPEAISGVAGPHDAPPALLVVRVEAQDGTVLTGDLEPIP